MTTVLSDRHPGTALEPRSKKERRGGKPKGYKHDGAQRQLAGSDASDVRRAFLDALNRALPNAGFAELRRLAPDDVPGWADRWWVHAPCVLEQAAAIVSAAEAEDEDELDVEVWKNCKCQDGLRCRHRYWYSYSHHGDVYVGKTRTSSHDLARRTARNRYAAAMKASGDPPFNGRSLLEQFNDSYRGPAVPRGWQIRLSALNGLEVETQWLDDVLDSSIEPIVQRPDFSAHRRQLDECVKSLAGCGKNGRRLADGWQSALSRAGDLQETSRLHRRLALLRRPLANLRRRRHLHRDVPHWLSRISAILNEADARRQFVSEARAKALKQPSSPWQKSRCIRPALNPTDLRCLSVKYCRYFPSSRLVRRAQRRSRCDARLSPRTARVLAPIAANPIRESRDDFLKRAVNHWNARADEVDDVLPASGQSVKAPASRPELRRHIDWLIRYQVKGESWAQVATDPIAVSHDTVRVEVQRLARLLDLKLRPGRPRGRPRRKR